jgi:hypothetical protein
LKKSSGAEKFIPNSYSGPVGFKPQTTEKEELRQPTRPGSVWPHLCDEEDQPKGEKA